MNSPKPPVSQLSTLNSQPSPHRRTGKIARLPKTTRDQINQHLLDGVPYRDIIVKLGLAFWNITEDNLHCWKQGGYQDWLRATEYLAGLRTQAGLATDLLRQLDCTAIHQASLHLALTQLTDIFRNFGPRLAVQDPQTYLRLLTALCRLSHQSLRYERCRQAACNQPRQSRPSDNNPSDQERRAAVNQLRQLLGLN